jgi:hypothetical protein
MVLDVAMFRDGDVIFTDQVFNPLSLWIKLLQGDFMWSHVCQYFGGKIYTTGAGGPLFYRFGPVEPGAYLKGKSFIVLRFAGLSLDQILLMRQKALSLVGNVYPLHKMIALALRGKSTPGVVKKLGLWPNPTPKNSFCSGSVVMCFQAAGITINPESGKLEPDAYSPESVYDDRRFQVVYPQLVHS